MDWLGLEPMSPREKPATNRLRYATAFVDLSFFLEITVFFGEFS
jgi:hypothetical protein